MGHAFAGTALARHISLELRFQFLDLARSRAQLLVGRPLPDASQCPAHCVSSISGNASRDQRVQRLQICRPEPRHDRGEIAARKGTRLKRPGGPAEHDAHTVLFVGAEANLKPPGFGQLLRKVIPELLKLPAERPAEVLGDLLALLAAARSRYEHPDD